MRSLVVGVIVSLLVAPASAVRRRGLFQTWKGLAGANRVILRLSVESNLGPWDYTFPHVAGFVGDHGHRVSRCPSGVPGHILPLPGSTTPPGSVTVFEPEEGVYEAHLLVALTCADGVVCHFDAVLPASVKNFTWVRVGTRAVGTFECTPARDVGALSLRLR